MSAKTVMIALKVEPWRAAKYRQAHEVWSKGFSELSFASWVRRSLDAVANRDLGKAAQGSKPDEERD